MKHNGNLVLGVDIGGSHITAGIIDLGTKKILQPTYFRAHIDPLGTADELMAAWSLVIDRAFSNVNVSGKRIGISMPGPFDYEQGISLIRGNKKYDNLYGLNIKELLAGRLNIEPENIKMLNDAAAFLQGEVLARTENHEHAIGLTLGTGLGSAVYHHGIACDSALWDSPFLNGIAEEYISTRWFTSRYFELTGVKLAGVKELNAISETSAIARSVFKEFAGNLGLFIENFATREDADIVIIGGNITHASARFLPALRSYLAKQNIHIPIQITKMGEVANLLGAAGCWINTVDCLL